MRQQNREAGHLKPPQNPVSQGVAQHETAQCGSAYCLPYGLWYGGVSRRQEGRQILLANE